ncbi:MAG TPA: M23 family metallopeptidase [Gaiellaceae bacterium]|nr:M23 family metallopeptidase [Gaiellaceae bacterium]
MARLPAVFLAVVALVLVVSSPSSARRVDGAGEFTFYPQAGILWQDLYPHNFVDLDPSPGVRDYACGTQTYDGHTGIDSDIRSFREMDLGVPVFAALDGRVISVQDGEYDRNFGATTARFDNHVVVEHGTGRFTIYGHLRKGIELRRSDRVVAGQQIGWTASSGNSSWPHLHFTSQVASEIHEPFSGACNKQPSGWVEQAPIPEEAYLKDFTLSTKPLSGKRDLPYDQAVRTGTFTRGTSVFYSRVEIGAILPPGSGQLRMRIVRPNGSVAGELTMTVVGRHGRGHWWFTHRVRLSTLGRWQIVVDFDGKTLGEVPIEVVGKASLVRNRPPNPIAVTLRPESPSPRGVVECRVATSLATEDPDLDIVRYRYRWTVDGKLVRAVRSAALSDVLRKGLAVTGKRVGCSVTPSDGRLSGPTASAQSTAR